jgi:hypothetical protein
MTSLLNKTVLQVERGNRKYSLECDSEAPLGEVYDAINELRGYIIDRIQQTKSDFEACSESEEKEVS